MGIATKIAIYSACVPCLKFAMSLFTHDGHIQSYLTEKAIQVKNTVGKWIKMRLRIVYIHVLMLGTFANACQF